MNIFYYASVLLLVGCVPSVQELAASKPNHLRAVDIDEDGDLDLAWFESQEGSQEEVLVASLQDEAGIFGPASAVLDQNGDLILSQFSFFAESEASDREISTFLDVEQDGDLDILTRRDSGAMIFLEKVDGFFVPSLLDIPVQFTEELPQAFVDLDKDGFFELIHINRNENVITVLSQSNTTFNTLSSINSINLNISITDEIQIISTDLNADNNVDIFIFSDGNSPVIFFNDGTGQLTEQKFPSEIKPNQVFIEDLNGDSLPDVVLFDFEEGISPGISPVDDTIESEIFISEQAGQFTRFVNKKTENLLSGTVGDIDNDGVLEIISQEYKLSLYDKVRERPSFFTFELSESLSARKRLNNINLPQERNVRAEEITILDVNNDGLNEIIYTTSESVTVLVP